MEVSWWRTEDSSRLRRRRRRRLFGWHWHHNPELQHSDTKNGGFNLIKRTHTHTRAHALSI